MNKLSPNKFLISRVSEFLINTGILHLTSFPSILTYICICGSGSVFRIRIRIQEAPEYGSNTDPDPQHCFEENPLIKVSKRGICALPLIFWTALRNFINQV